VTAPHTRRATQRAAGSAARAHRTGPPRGPQRHRRRPTHLHQHAAVDALAADLPRLWDSPTTSHRDRKRLLRSLIADITLLPATDDDSVRIGVRWHTGATDELTALRQGPGRTPPVPSNWSAATAPRTPASNSPNGSTPPACSPAKANHSPLALSPAPATPTRSGHPAQWPSKTARSASNTPPRNSASPLTPSTTGSSKVKCQPAGPRRTLVHPLGSRNAAGLPGESCSVVPAHAQEALPTLT
jgi:hypothetical protein